MNSISLIRPTKNVQSKLLLVYIALLLEQRQTINRSLAGKHIYKCLLTELLSLLCRVVFILRMQTEHCCKLLSQ